jgi:hypothetical protein
MSDSRTPNQSGGTGGAPSGGDGSDAPGGEQAPSQQVNPAASIAKPAVYVTDLREADTPDTKRR